MHSGDDDQQWRKKCVCGKAFYKPNSYSNHTRSCQAYKNDAMSILETAQAKFAKKRKQKKGREAIESWYGAEGSSLDVDREPATAMAELPIQQQPEEIIAPEPMPLGRGLRVRAPPKQYQDFLATSAIPFEIPMFGVAIDSPPRSPSPMPPTIIPTSAAAERRNGILDRNQWRQSRGNAFHLFKVYWTTETRPHDPDLYLSDIETQAPDHDVLGTSQAADGQATNTNPYHPFPNWSSYQLSEWRWSEGDGRTGQSFQRLLAIIGDEEFSASDIRSTNWRAIDSILAASEFEDDLTHTESHWFEDGTSWNTTSVTVTIPFNSATSNPGPKPFAVEGFRFRPLLSVIRAKLEDKHSTEHFHVVPSELWWRPSIRESVRVYGDLYHSDAFLEAYREVQLLPPEADEDDLPRSVVALMFASDETHLTTFGDAQLWPVYMHFGNDSKLRRGKASLKLYEEVAYFQKLPDSFTDWYLQRSGKSTVAAEVLRHVKRELFQEQWMVLLDRDFVHAYEHGLVVNCGDGVRRRFYPRIISYSADYPERMRVVGLRTTGDFRCSRCLVSIDEIPQMGTPSDQNIRSSRMRVDDNERKAKVSQAREHIYGKSNYAVNAAKVEALLKPTSLVPAKNAFSERLGSLGLDVYKIPAVDPLHEVEIGSWKDLFTHLLRILESIGVGKTEVLNERYRQTPTFGRDTIRRFRSDVSAMKQLGGRDLEDILQCSVPTFEGLLPEDDDNRTQDLLFAMAHWHGLAKLRMHTDLTLELLESWTSVLGEAARTFVALTCSSFKTRELKREYEARKRKDARKSTSKNWGGKRGGKKKDQPSIPPQEQSSVPMGQSLGLSRHAATLGTATHQGSGASTSVSVGQAFGGLPTVYDITESSALAHLGPHTSTDALQAAGSLGASLVLESETGQSQGEGRKLRSWSLSTPKYHSLGDVVQYIRRTGTTDSYSTQLSERYHRFPKSRYRRTNKKNVPKQLSRIQTRQARIKRLRNQLYPSRDELGPSSSREASDSGGPAYFIGKSQSQTVNVPHFLQLNANDPATRGFMAKLKRHLFPRIIDTLIQELRTHPEAYPDDCALILQATTSSEPSERDLDSIYLHSDSIYRHNILQIRYTTYDCRQDTDTINPRTPRRDIMCLAAREQPSMSPSELGTEASVDYVYGRVLGVFHANVIYGGTGALDFRRRRFDFLWVRWYTTVTPGSWNTKRLDTVKPGPLADSNSWGFLDPSHVLRGAHVIPRFSQGRQYDEVPSSSRIFSKAAQDRLDWKEYYINRFVDRDMIMRYHKGLAVGHTYFQGVEHELPQPVDPGIPMEVDPPTSDYGIQPRQSDESDDGRTDSTMGSEDSAEESEASGSDIPEPDSEEDVEIYG